MRRITRRIKYKLDPWLIKFSLLLNWPALTAIVIASSADILNPAGKHVVLALRRSVFTQDLKAMAKFSGRIKYVVIEREYLRQIFHHFLGPTEASQVAENNYHTSEIGREGKEKYYSYLQRLVPVLQRKFGFAAVLAANIGYLEQQELARVCENGQIPFIILHKEGLAAPGDLENRVRLYKNHKFIGSKLLLYNDPMRQGLLNLPLQGLAAEQAVTVGVPRLDHYFAREGNGTKNQQVVFFSFYPSDKFLSWADGEQKKQEALRQSDEFHRWVMEFAASHPDFQVVIKTKSAPRYLEYVNNIRKSFRENDLSNLTITNSADPTELVKNSAAVLGFNSTTLIEALLSGKIVITPDFSQLFSDFSLDFFRDFPEGINYARSSVDLERLILSADQAKKFSREQLDQFLQQMIYTPDGQASQRAESAIINTIGQRIKS